MSHFKALLILALAVGSLMMGSCVLPFGTPTGGLSVHVKFPRQLARAAGYTLADLGSWEVLGRGPDGAVIPADYTRDANQAVVTGLVPGDWSITVNAMDSTGELILTGTGAVTLIAGQPNEVAIDLQDANAVQINVDFIIPEQPTLSVDHVTNGVAVNSQSNLVEFDSSSDSSVSLQATAGFDSYAWYVNNNLDTPVCESSECVLSGTNQVNLLSGTSTILLVVGKNDQYYSLQFWVTDTWMQPN